LSEQAGNNLNLGSLTEAQQHAIRFDSQNHLNSLHYRLRKRRMRREVLTSAAVSKPVATSP